jgi:hypothetical protein
MKTTTLLTIAAALLGAARIASAAPFEPHIVTFFDDERPTFMAASNATPTQVAIPHDAARMAGKPGHRPGDLRAREAAARGSEPLRRFITRTEGIYQLRYDDYLRP